MCHLSHPLLAPLLTPCTLQLLETTRLKEQLLATSERSETLLDVVKAVTSELEPTSVMSKICCAANDLLRVQEAMLYLVDMVRHQEMIKEIVGRIDAARGNWEISVSRYQFHSFHMVSGCCIRMAGLAVCVLRPSMGCSIPFVRRTLQ